MTHSSGRASRDGRKPPAQPPTGYTSQMVRCVRVGSIASSNHTKSEDARDHRLRRKFDPKKHANQPPVSVEPRTIYVFAGRKLCRLAGRGTLLASCPNLAPEAGFCVHACAVPLQSMGHRGKSATAATSVFSVHRGSSEQMDRSVQYGMSRTVFSQLLA